MKSPFQFGKIVEGATFTNRDQEIKRLISNFENNLHTLIISPRRWGKSSLVKVSSRRAARKHSDFKFCFIDLFRIRNEDEFYTAYAREVIKATSKKTEEWVAYAKSFLTRITPRFSFGTDPIHDFEITFDFDRKTEAFEEILDFPEKVAKKRNIKIVMCIDEFQNLSFFRDPLLFQKRLRSAWQHHQHTVYCIYGSKRTMLAHLFGNKSMPFYKFGDILYLDKILKSHLVRFVVKGFERTEKQISQQQVEKIVDWMQCHPYYVQQLSHMVWIATESKVSDTILETTLNDLILQNGILYEREIENLSNTQINFIRALADGVQEALSSAEILKSYNLGTSGNVVKIKRSLEKKEIISNVHSIPEFIDPAFELWFKRIYCK